MTHALTAVILSGFRRVAEECGVEKLVLFGSRARGTHAPKSDIDLAVYGGDFARFAAAAEEEVWTLLQFDLIEMKQGVSRELASEIEREGVVIYEKV